MIDLSVPRVPYVSPSDVAVCNEADLNDVRPRLGSVPCTDDGRAAFVIRNGTSLSTTRVILGEQYTIKTE